MLHAGTLETPLVVAPLLYGTYVFVVSRLGRLEDGEDRMVEGIEAGNVSINTLEASLPETPFGGIKSSGYGREGGTEGLHNYMITKNVSHSLSIV